MARSNLSDFLQVYAFWLMDVHPIEGIALPIFNPLAGFNTISAPALSIDTTDVNEGNWMYSRKVVKGASVDPMTLTRGVTFFDSDFWRWTLAAVTGNTENFRIGLLPQLPIGGPSPRRKLVLVHFFTHAPLGNLMANAASLLTAGPRALTNTLTGSDTAGVVSRDHRAGKTRKFSGARRLGIGPFEFVDRLPAKAWLLHGCIPTRFKSGGDLDASSGEISIAELEIAPEMIEEISLASS